MLSADEYRLYKSTLMLHRVPRCACTNGEGDFSTKITKEKRKENGKDKKHSKVCSKGNKTE